MADENPEPEVPEGDTPQLSRAEMMKRIAEQRNADFEEETGIKIEQAARVRSTETGRFTRAPGDEPEGEEEETAASAPAEAEPAARQPETDASPAREEQPASAPPPVHRIKVRGVERDVTTEELIALAQRGEDADRAYYEAQRLRDEAARLRAEEARARLQTPEPAAQRQPAAEPADDLKGWKEDLEAAYLGDDAAMERFIQRVRSTGAQPAAGLPATEIQERVRDDVDMDGSIKMARSEYPELFQDHDAATLASEWAFNRRVALLKEAGQRLGTFSPSDVDQAIRAEGLEWLNRAFSRAHRRGLVPMSTEDVFREAGDHARKRLGLGSQRDEEPAPTTVNRPAASAAKAAAVSPPAPRTVRARLGEDERERAEDEARASGMSLIRPPRRPRPGQRAA